MDKLAIIGGSYLQLPIVLKAKEMGIETHCFSWKDGAVCEQPADFFYPISIIEKDEILEKCKEIGINGILTIASDVAVITVNYVAEHLGLVANPWKYTDITTNKYEMRRAFMDNGVPSPKFILVKKGESANTENLYLPLIVKPTDRSGSRGVEKITDYGQIEKAVERACCESFKNEAIIEEFIEGHEVSVESISYRGKHYILQITDKVTTGAPYFVELGHHQPSNLPDFIKTGIKDIVFNALDALHIKNGASHSELKINDDGVIKVIEIGARMGGDFIGSDLVMLSTGYDFLKGVIQVSLGRFEEPQIIKNKCSGVFFLSKETESILPIIKNAHMYPQAVRAEITSEELKEIRESADRSGYIIYCSDSRWECR